MNRIPRFGLLALLLLARSASALEVRAFDAKTGERLRRLQCGLVEPASRTVISAFRGEVYDEKNARPPRAGEVLYVYRRGYDLGAVALRGGERSVDVRLEAARRACTVRVADGTGFTLHISVSVVGLERRKPVHDPWVVRVEGGRTEFPLGEGLQAILLAEPDRGILWPHIFRILPGEERLLTRERPREVRVLLEEGVPPPDPTDTLFLADLLWNPGAEGRRIDAWRWHMGRGDWLGESWVPESGRLTVLPNVPFHLFTLVGKAPVYRYVGRCTESIDLSGSRRLKPVAARPVLDGRPAPEGTILAPGRLDAYALSRARKRSGFAHVVEGSEWGKVALPDADRLTAWHKEFGLAHLRWSAARPPKGSFYPGLLLVTLPPGHDAEGYVSVFPVWRGGGTVRTVPPDAMFRRRFDDTRRLRFRGLRPGGTYGMDIQVALTERKSGRTVQIGRMAETRIPKEHPTAHHSIALRR